MDNDKNIILKTSEIWEIGPIEIDDDDPFKDWMSIEIFNEWCTGAGTPTDPYIIENVSINGQGSSNCIHILNSNVFFIIRNCIFYDTSWYNPGSPGYPAIQFYNVKNGIIINNNCSFSHDHGIELNKGSNIIIANNTISNNRRGGIELEYQSNCLITGNVIYDNGHDGIALRGDCNNNTVWGNFIYECGYSGILIQGGSNDNTIKENKIFSWWRGIFPPKLGEGISIYLNSRYNIIQNNEISYCCENGMRIEGSPYNIIKENIIVNTGDGISGGDGIRFDCWVNENNTNNIVTQNVIGKNEQHGILVESYSNDSFFYINEFVDNRVNAEDDGTNNQWDNGTIGNFWDDYTGVDLNFDNIGDLPYNLSGLSGSQDNFPIYNDIFPPAIVVNRPFREQLFGFNAPRFDLTIIDHSLNYTWYTLDNGITNISFTGSIDMINQVEWDKQSSGRVIIRFYANDSLGNLGVKDVLIWKDITKPIITIHTPVPDQVCGIAAPNFSLTIDEPNLQSKIYSFNNGDNITFTTETTFDQAEWDKVGDGMVIITFYAIDTVNNIGKASVSIIKRSPQKISGYNIFLSIGFISLIIIIKYRYKQNQ